MFTPSVRQVIESDCLKIAPETPVKEAIALMSRANASYVLVVGATEGIRQLMGVFTERDVARLVASDAPLEGRAIAEVMSQPLVTLQESQARDIFAVLKLYQQHRIRHVPIVDERGQLVGVVTPEMICEELVAANDRLQAEIAERVGERAALEQVREELEQFAIAQTAELLRANQLLQQEIRDRQRAEEALRASREMLRLVMDNIPQAIFWKDTNSIYLGCNRKFAADVGLSSPSDVAGKSDYDLHSLKEEADFFCEVDRRVMAANAPEYHIIEPLRRPNGEQAWLDANKIPLHDAGGKVVGILGTYEDITERKRIEEALIESEAKFRFLFERSADALLILDGDIFIDCNQAAVEMLRASSKEEILNRHPSELSPAAQPDGRSSQEKSAALNAAAIERGSLRFEWVHRRVDGEEFPVEVLLTAIPLQEKRLLYVVWRDITERKKLEATLLSTERRLRRQSRALLELATRKTLVSGDLPSALRDITEVASRTLDVDRASVWLYVEEGAAIACLDLYQRSDRRHAAGMELRAADYPAYFRSLQQARLIAAHDARIDSRTREFSPDYLSSLGITSMLDAPIRKGGQMVGVICCEHVGEPRQWAIEEESFAGSLADFVALAMEGVERRRAEEALQRANAELEMRVQERTVELTNAIAQLQTEIDSRIRAEEKLRLIESAVQQANDAVVITTAELQHPGPQIVYLNPAFTAITGYALEEAIGQTPRILQGAKTDREVLARLRAELTRGEPFFGEVVNYCKGGGEYVTEITITPIRDRGGALTHFVAIQRDITERKLAEEQLRCEQQKSENLLLNILPKPIADRLKRESRTIADGFSEVTILFADIVNFTQLSERISPTELVELLNEIFSAFDELTDRHALEKIKTIGDAYMVASGLPEPRSDHAEAIAEMALDMQQEVARFNAKHGTNLNIRVGINTGPVVAGVIGTKKFIYDLWGDAVNTASRMESHGLPGSIQVTESTYELLRGKYLFEERGIVQIKGKGEMTTYLLSGRQIFSLSA